jgi:hypothetical protein
MKKATTESSQLLPTIDKNEADLLALGVINGEVELRGPDLLMSLGSDEKLGYLIHIAIKIANESSHMSNAEAGFFVQGSALVVKAIRDKIQNDRDDEAFLKSLDPAI